MWEHLDFKCQQARKSFSDNASRLHIEEEEEEEEDDMHNMIPLNVLQTPQYITYLPQLQTSRVQLIQT